MLKRKSIKFQLLLIGFFLTLSAIVGTTFFVSRRFINNLLGENVNHSLEMFRQSEERILSLLSNVHTTAFKTWSSEDILYYLTRERSSASEEAIAQYAFVQEVKKTVNSTSDIAAVVYIDPEGRLAGYSQNLRFFTTSQDCDFYTRLVNLEFDYRTNWVGLVYSNDLLSHAQQLSRTIDHPMICGIRKHEYTLSHLKEPQYVYILFELNADTLLHTFSHLEDDGSSVFLLDEQGQTLSGSYPIGSVPEFFDLMDHPDSSSFSFQYEDRSEAQIIYYKMKTTGWTLVKSTPMTTYTEKIHSMWRSAATICGISFVLVLILYSICTRKICVPITRLTDSICELKNGNFDSRVPLKDTYPEEIYLVCDQFNALLDNLNQLLLQKEWDERQRTALEIKTLQAQITPHFIYNSLTSIRYMAFAQGAGKVEEALVTFSNIIRPIFSTWQSNWKLCEELEFIENYIYLIRLRFGNLINIEIDADEKANICCIPRFALQTLLENCCEHGFQGDHILQIKLTTVIKDDGILYITVKDDGTGIPEEKLIQIRNNIANGVYESSIGLVNLDRRIKLFCGSEFGLHIRSTYHEGTEITVQIRVIT